MHELAQIIVSGLSQGSIYALLGLGFSLVYFGTGILNVMQGGYALLAAYLHIALAPVLGTAAAFAVVLVCIAIVGVVTERIVYIAAKPWKPVSHIMAVLITLALLVIVEGAVLLIWGSDPKRGIAIQNGIVRVAGAIAPKQSFWNLGIAVSATVLLTMFLHHTWTGRLLRANHDNSLMCNLIGANVRVIGAVAFSLAAVLGGLAGMLSSPITWVEPEMGGMFMLYGMLAFMIGGIDRVWAPLAGGLLLGVGENLFLLIPGWSGGLLKQVMPMGILLLLIVFRPQGLLGGRGESGGQTAGGRT